MLDEFSMTRAHTCCFTGSRPSKLGFDWQAQPYLLEMLRRDLRAAIVRAIKQDYTHFITGMSSRGGTAITAGIPTHRTCLRTSISRNGKNVARLLAPSI